MIDRTGWHKAFKAGDAAQCVAVMHQAWSELVDASPETFHEGEKEHHLTRLLCEYLADTRANTRLTGLWSYENQQGRLDRKNPKGIVVTHRKRTDIRYFSNREEPTLNLIFEFKKLDHRKTARDGYVDEGMVRFITGEYSIGQPLALMVGILTVHRDDSLPPLRQWLDSADAKSLLFMETLKPGQRRVPSAFFAQADFDTEHLRPRDKAPSHGTIVISHMFLDFPNLPRIGARRRRQTVATP
jgi:hypothetical protein